MTPEQIIVGGGALAAAGLLAEAITRWRRHPAIKTTRGKGGVMFAGRHWTWEQLSQGTLATGGIGAGKTKSLEPLQEEAMRAGCPMLYAAVKPDEPDRVERMARRAGAHSRFVRIAPGGPYRLNLLHELTKPPYGSVLGAAQFLMNLSEINQRSGGGRENEGFWKTQEETALYCGISLALMTLDAPTIANVWEAISTSPNTAEEAQSDHYDPDTEAKGRGEFALMLQVARRLRRPQDAADLKRIESFYLNELPSVDKIRGAVLSAVGGTLGRFVTEPWATALSSDTSTLTPKVIEGEQLIAVLDYPLMRYFMPARLFQIAWIMLAQRYLMARDASGVEAPFWVARDEAGWVIHPEWDSAAHNVLRSQKCAGLATVQDVNMFEAALGGGPKAHHECANFISNHINKLFLTNNSKDTNDLAVALIGQSKQLMWSGGEGGGKSDGLRDELLGVSSHVHWREEYQPIFRPEDFTKLPVGHAVLHTGGEAARVNLRF